jgi:hypothetical protein
VLAALSLDLRAPRSAAVPGISVLECSTRVPLLAKCSLLSAAKLLGNQARQVCRCSAQLSFLETRLNRLPRLNWRAAAMAASWETSREEDGGGPLGGLSMVDTQLLEDRGEIGVGAVSDLQRRFWPGVGGPQGGSGFKLHTGCDGELSPARHN